MNIKELMARRAMKDAGDLVDDMFDIPRGSEIDGGTVHITLPACGAFKIKSPELAKDLELIASVEEVRQKLWKHNANELARYEDECFMLGKDKATPPAIVPMGISEDDEYDDWGDK